MTRVVVADGVELEVRLEAPAGAADAQWTALYLHGFGSRQSGEKATYFRSRLLEAGIPFCSFDFRGHGESGGDLGELTLSRSLEDLARVRAWLAERGHRRIVLFGSSMGGATALAEAARHPAGIAACLLIAPAVNMAGQLERWAGPVRLAAWRREGSLRFENELIEVDLRWDIVPDLRLHDFHRIARALSTPSLVLQGGRDDSVDFRDVLAFVSATSPGLVDVVLWADGDHRMLDRRREMWSEMKDFLLRRALLGGATEDDG